MIKSQSQTILVVNDVEATRDGIKEMLERDGYRVLTVRDERDAAEKKDCLGQVDLILISLEGEMKDVIAAARGIRRFVRLNENLPIVIFCNGETGKEESLVERNVYFSCPDDFNRLRKFIGRVLLAPLQEAAQV